MTEPTRLSWEDVREAVTGLSTAVLEQLAEGPLPDKDGDGYDCRVCMVLGLRADVSPPAGKLKFWHEFLEPTPKLDELTGPWATFPEESKRKQVYDEWRRFAGELAYARCMAIYLAAEAELCRRELEATHG